MTADLVRMIHESSGLRATAVCLTSRGQNPCEFGCGPHFIAVNLMTYNAVSMWALIAIIVFGQFLGRLKCDRPFLRVVQVNRLTLL